MRFPEQHHVAVVGVDTRVDVLVQRRVTEVDGAAFAEVAVEEGVELVEQFLVERREGRKRGAHVGQQARRDPLEVAA